MVRQGRKASQSKIPQDMLNFHFSSSPPANESPMNQNSRRRHQNNRNRQYHSSEKDRSSARRKAASSMFYLHSSADHAFVLTRVAKQGYTYSGPDVAVMWDRVRAVKYLAPSTDSTQTVNQETCPICLDEFTCVRITKCGHCFCLPCLLRYVHTTTASNATVGVKCPCCGLPIHMDDIRPVIMESVQPPKVQKKMKLIKLHRAKTCFTPYLPQKNQWRHESPHTAPLPSDADSKYSRFNYVDPISFHAHLTKNERELEKHILEVQNEPDAYEVLFAQMALESVRAELRQALAERSEEEALMERYQQQQTGMYQRIPLYVFDEEKLQNEEVKDAPVDATHLQNQVRLRGISIGSESEASVHSGNNTGARLRCISIGSESENSVRLGRPGRSGSIDSYSSQERRRRERVLPVLPASAYVEEGSYQFYQSEDGQLCFLSKFNMNCLSTEFSAQKPEALADEQLTLLERRKCMPFPDAIEGNVIEVERVHLTFDLRKRMPFLAHLPVHTDVSFVELDLNRILSNQTKQKMKGEFEKRRRRRKNKKDAEKRADKAIKEREEQRINDLKARMQRIDPNDEFFAVPDPAPVLTGEEFGPSISSTSNTEAPASASPQISFRSVVATPSSMAMTEEAFPSLGGPTPAEADTNRQQSWSRGWHVASTSQKNVENSNIAGSPPAYSGGGRGKKSKGKKIVLFSTGGHRGQG